MSINLHGERYFVSLPRKADPIQFKRIMLSQQPNELKDYLKSIEASLHRFETECILNGEAEGHQVEFFGQQITVYDLGFTTFLCNG